MSIRQSLRWEQEGSRQTLWLKVAQGMRRRWDCCDAAYMSGLSRLTHCADDLSVALSGKREDSVQITHQAEQQRFVAQTNGELAELTYTLPQTRVLDLQHTFVPPAARQQGVAGALVEYAVRYAQRHDHKIIPSCPFVKAWLAKHPQERDAVLYSQR